MEDLTLSIVLLGFRVGPCIGNTVADFNPSTLTSINRMVARRGSIGHWKKEFNLRAFLVGRIWIFGRYCWEAIG